MATSPFVAEIRLFGGNFAPRGWAFCAGQILAIQQNTALFSLLGTTYGGNGTSTFGLPNLRDRIAIGAGQGPGLSPRSIGETGGVSSVTLATTQMPQHTHAPQGSASAGTSADPGNAVWAANVGGRTPPPLYANTAPGTAMATAALAQAGGNQSHENLQPVLGMNYIIALQGLYPARN